MRLIILLAFCCSISGVAVAQKAKFKAGRAYCQKIRLPNHYVAPENRTYSIYTKGIYASNITDGSQGIYGWTYDENAPALEAVVSLYGFRINPVSRSSEKREKKDKDGKVTETWTEYKYSSSAEGKATLYVYGQSERFKYDDRPKSERAKKREEEAAAAKEKDLADNPFLAAEDAKSDDEGESNIAEDAGLDNNAMPLVERRSMNVSMSASTRYNRSASAAYKEYRSTTMNQFYDFRDNYPDQVYTNSLRRLNAQYGYSPIQYTVGLKLMKSEKHPEFKMWNDACQAAQTLFKQFKFNHSIADQQKKFDPIISYFNQQVEGIDDNDKKGKKLKKAAFVNMINIMYYLDRYEQVMTLCATQKDSKLLGRSAEKMSEKAKRQVALLAFHNVESCHFEEMAALELEDIESVEEEEVEEGARR